MLIVKEISTIELQAMRDGAVEHQLIDVREPYEAELCSLGGTLIPMAQIVERRNELRHDVPVIIHCRSGNRAAAVVQALCSRYGFNNLFNLSGGILSFSTEVDSNIFCD